MVSWFIGCIDWLGRTGHGRGRTGQGREGHGRTGQGRDRKGREGRLDGWLMGCSSFVLTFVVLLSY